MKWLFLIFFYMFSTSAKSQLLNSKSLELTTYVRHEIQGQFVSQYGTLPYKTDLKLSGTSFGIDFGYNMIVSKGWFVTPSIGYYRLTVDKIINKGIPATIFGTRHYRTIDYRPDSMPVGYSTQKYYYNNLTIGIALGKEFTLNNKYQFTAGMCFNYLLNYSQKYYIGKIIYKTNTKDNLGYIVTGSIGVNRTFNNFYIGINILLPVFKEFRKDIVLLDNPDERFNKWFGGYGFSLKFAKYLN